MLAKGVLSPRSASTTMDSKVAGKAKRLAGALGTRRVLQVSCRASSLRFRATYGASLQFAVMRALAPECRPCLSRTAEFSVSIINER